jgi:hypothetical protein
MPAAQNSWGDPVDDATGPLDAAGNSFDLGPENPREILGLAADEIRPDAIISAARRNSAITSAGLIDEMERGAIDGWLWGLLLSTTGGRQPGSRPA